MLSLLATIAAMPWLQGFDAAATADRATRSAVDQLAEWQPADDHCAASAYGGLDLTADLTPAAGDEHVLASFTQGIVVLDRDRHLIARAPAFPCQGSADDVLALSVGDAWIGSPVLALAATTGGKNENVTWVTLYRVGDRGELVSMFTGAVERHQGHHTRTGIILLYPGGLLYQTPEGATQLWRFDPGQRRYINRGSFAPNA